jgi:hypothetical protein
MNSPKLSSILRGAPDALYDDVEHDLLALTTASLDDEDGAPPTVDEFATDFLLECRQPPCEGGPQY